MGFTLNQLEQERQIRKLQKKEDKDTKDYEQLSNLPKINNVELKGDKTTGDLGINANNVMMSDGVTSVEVAITGLVKSHVETGLTTNQYGVVNLTLSSTKYVLDAVCSNYIVIPFRSLAGNHWDLVITDIGSDGAIIAQANKTVDILVHYI